MILTWPWHSQTHPGQYWQSGGQLEWGGGLEQGSDAGGCPHLLPALVTLWLHQNLWGLGDKNNGRLRCVKTVTTSCSTALVYTIHPVSTGNACDLVHCLAQVKCEVDHTCQECILGGEITDWLVSPASGFLPLDWPSYVTATSPALPEIGEKNTTDCTSRIGGIIKCNPKQAEVLIQPAVDQCFMKNNHMHSLVPAIHRQVMLSM